MRGFCKIMEANVLSYHEANDIVGEKNNNLDSFESGVENMAQALLDSFHEIQPSENLIKSPEL